MQGKRYKHLLLALSLVLFLGLGTSLAFAQGGTSGGQQFPVGLNTISYQGRVTVNGQPYNGTGYFKFAIVDSLGDYTWNSDVIVQAQDASQQIGPPQNPIPIPVHQGLFSVRLGAFPDMSPIPPLALADPDAALRVWFSTDGTHFTQLPDQLFSATAWALMADTLDGYDSSDFALWDHDHWGQSWSGYGQGLELHSNDGWGLDVSTDSSKDFATAIYGKASSSTGQTVGMWGVVESGSDDAIGVWGQANSGSGKTYGVYGQNVSTTDDAAGVFGWAQGMSGEIYGVYGRSSSDDGYGVFGLGSDNGVGVRGESSAGKGVVGFSYTGIGVYGSGWFFGNAGMFENATTVTPTVLIHNLNSTAGAPALVVTGTTTIRGTENTIDRSVLDVVNDGDYGNAIYGMGYTGVAGESDHPQGYGVYGSGASETGYNIGVFGSSASPDGVGVEGRNMRGGYAAYFTGMESAPADLEGHVVVIENMGGGGSAGADVLAIVASGESATPGSNVNFTTFFAGDTAVGAIEGNGSGGVIYKSGGADFAELLPATEGLQPGDVVVIGPDGRLIRSTQANQTNVAGVYSTAPGFLGGMTPDMEAREAQEDAFSSRAPIAIVGIVPVKVSAENGAIRPGDLLTPSNTPGHAMKAEPVNVGGVEFYRPGTIIGKALEPLDKGTGVIRALITLH